MDENQVRKMIQEAFIRFLEGLKLEVASMPMRADGNINLRDFHETLDIVQKKIRTDPPLPFKGV